MEIDEIVDYATNSPENTNPAVLRDMLSQLNGGSSGDYPYVIETVYDDTIGEYGAVRTVKTAAEVYEICNAALEAGVPVLCGEVDGKKVIEVYCDEAGDEADGDLRYILTITTMQIPTDFNATTMYVRCLSTAVLIADVNDQPFVFHTLRYGFSDFGWTIPLTREI